MVATLRHHLAQDERCNRNRAPTMDEAEPDLVLSNPGAQHRACTCCDLVAGGEACLESRAFACTLRGPGWRTVIEVMRVLCNPHARDAELVGCLHHAHTRC